MKTKLMLFIGFAVVCCTAICACSTSKGNIADTVPYRIAQRYFVRNDVVGLPPVLITTDEEFERNFGMATAMGPDGRPTEIDFKKDFVICVALEPTDVATSLSVRSVTRNDAGQLVVRYEVKRGDTTSYTTQPFVLLIMDKKFELPVRLEAD